MPENHAFYFFKSGHIIPPPHPQSLPFLQLHPLGSSLQLHFFLTLSLRFLLSQSTNSFSSCSTSSPPPEGLPEVSLLWHGMPVASGRKLQGGRFMRAGSWRVRVLAPPCSLSASSRQPKPLELSFKKFHLILCCSPVLSEMKPCLWELTIHGQISQ
ncbi:unnamed protein product, partial [Vitis vinifera]|uniref:Uncharacterized protein n=1 Tax=Vitis vinifera TaxID=29760 RepID=D7U8R1_VITVI